MVADVSKKTVVFETSVTIYQSTRRSVKKGLKSPLEVVRYTWMV